MTLILYVSYDETFEKKVTYLIYNKKELRGGISPLVLDKKNI